MADLETQIQKLSAAIAGLESQRKSLGDAVVDPAIAALREQLTQLESARGGRAETDERKLVTIVFADVSGFTALSERLDPEKVREVINACFDWLVPVVQKYEGTIDKFIGDEIMAVFGAPVAHEDDAERALRAALDLMDAIVAFNHANGTELGLHIGINTGLVVAGEIGGRDRRDYSVIGDAVNLAARLEDASSVGEIFVGPATYRQTQRLFDFELVAPLKLKGKEVPVEVCRLLRAKAVPKPMRGIEGLRAPLIGRDDELTEIRKAISDLERGRGSMLAILGEAGLGKSRLIAETRVLLPVNVTWGEGRALSFTAGMSYWLAREIVMSLLNVKPEAAQSEVAAALQKSLDGQAEIYPFLARLLELPMDPAMEDRVKFLSSEALRSGILEALGGYVRRRARHEPLVLVWEDLHWCDPSSWEVLEMLAPVSNEVPLLLLCAARLEDNRLLEGLQKNDGRCVRHIIRLSPLTRDESGSLIQQLLKIENFPAGMRELILNRAEGNPFFVEELLRSLIDAGAIVLEGNRAAATHEIDAVEIPETLQGVGCWRRASIGCRPTTSKPCNAPPSLAGFFKGACSPIYMSKERSIDLRLHSVNCNGANLFNRASSKRQKRLGWKKANIFSSMPSRMMSPTTRCFSRGARNCISLPRKRSKRCFPAGSRNSPLRWDIIMRGRTRPNGQYFIWDEQRNERKQPLPMRRPLLSTNRRSGKLRAPAAGNFVKAG